ncbi:pectate lyase-like adhesive domain-containing protein [Vagococcus luciliae]|uniref:WxL domain-containing protein n=1 Tax=Vagococcus luciliae TaxID=2920380 RepID=A0ABY5P0J9_9ENTE|nr:pectate lyase-like adhesive domain-containing protein [Vagococcus luciliae]UUV99460.1 hypothetical protein G314FT_16210 [Vagococcus luciliae]
MKKKGWMGYVLVALCSLTIGSERVWAQETSNSNSLISPKQAQVVSSKKQFGGLQNLKQFSLDNQGTGIVAYNFGKSMEDIKALNGDEQAAKEMILYESGATATGLIGDVTDKIQVGDLGDLFSTSSNDLAEHHVTLTVPAEYSGTGKELSTDVIIYTGKVAKPTTFRELDTALQSTDVAIVDVQNSMSNSTNISPGWLSQNKKDFVLLGNGYSVDFYNACYAWADSYNSNKAHKPVVDNIDMYGTNYFGPVTMYNLITLGASITYRNVNYLGSQITACFQATIRFAGKNNVKSVYPGYTSYDGTNRTNTNGQGQAGLESHTLVFEDNTDTTIASQDGDGVILGSWYSNWDPVQSIQPSMKVGKNANVVIKTIGNGNGESLFYQVTEYAWKIPSVINIQRNGRIDIDKGGKLTTETGENTDRILVRLGYNSAVPSEWYTTINLGEDSQFIGNINGPIATSSVAGFILSKNSQINVGKNSKMIVNSKNTTTGLPLFQLGDNSQVNVAESGNLTVNKNGGNGKILNLGAGSLFNVSDEGNVQFVSDGEGTSTDSMIYGANKSTFIIGERGLFTSHIKSGTGTRTMLDFASGANFKFANARRIDLDARGNAKASLIGMATGDFLADIQAVKAWTKEDAGQSDDHPSYDWSPMYGIDVRYNGSSPSKITANSLTYKMRDDFINNYKTQNMSRVLFDYIPDVNIGFDELSDNPKLSSSQIFKGVVNNGSSVAFYKVVDEKDPSKDMLLPNATVPSPVEGESKKYHVVASNTGTYEFKVPSDFKLVAGDKIKAYGFLNGKDDYVINTVQDKTPPTAEDAHYYLPVHGETPDPGVLVINVSDTNPNNKNYTYQYNEANPKETIDAYMSEIGDHKVKVDVSDEAGNTATIDTTLSVVESSTHVSGEELSISFKDLRNMSEKQMKEYILSKGNVSAYKLLNGKKIDLSKFVSVKDLGGLADIEHIKSTPYTISLVVSAKDAGEGVSDDITGTMTVKVTDIDAVLTISFINEAGKVLDDYTTTVKALVGDTLDLTKDKNIKTQQELLKSNGYLLGSGPDQETAFKVTDTEMTLVYHVEGTVMIQSVPTVLDFGTVKYTASPNRVEKPTYDKPLVVSDTRANVTDGWSMYAQMSSPLQTTDGKVLEDVIHYVSNGKDTVLSENSQAIFSDKENKAGIYDISNGWGDKPKSDGIKLELGSSGDIHTGSYTGEITWKIMEGQP